jgi:hypothetical protein
VLGSVKWSIGLLQVVKINVQVTFFNEVNWCVTDMILAWLIVHGFTVYLDADVHVALLLD